MSPPTINHAADDEDPEIDYKLNFTFNQAQRRTVRAALSNTFGSVGTTRVSSSRSTRSNTAPQPRIIKTPSIAL